MSIFIRSSACLSPQNTFGENSLGTEIIEHRETWLRPIEPDYSKLIDHKALRRMSHVIRMGVATARKCLDQASVSMPDAIMVGTAYGSLESSSSFLISTIERNEEDLSPKEFMQSTHNTVASQIALSLKCHGHNNNFGHKGFSFESAVQEGIMLLNDQDAASVLVGGIDEMTDTSFAILSRLGLYKRNPVLNLDIFKSPSKGTIGGEGAAFFFLSKKASPANLAELVGIQIFYKPIDGREIEQRIENFLKAKGIQVSDIDLLIAGKNGDPKNDQVYENLAAGIFRSTPRACYKHLCGDYPTSSSFALWLAAGIVQSGLVPPVIKDGNAATRNPKRVLIYNCYLGSYHSLMLLSDRKES
ncbi:beta-ketoacyl synthase chain length factor [soil metagenome]